MIAQVHWTDQYHYQVKTWSKRIADEIIFLNEGKMVEHLNKQEFFSNSKSIEVQNYLNGIL